jgi:hypothetical protein
MLKFVDVEQNSDEWLILRAGKLTASSVSKVMANGDKAFGDPAKRLAVDIALGQITGQPQSSGYTNAHMERGHEQEPVARALYETETFSAVSNGGFFCDDFLGCSPDGVVDSGLIEIKSVVPHVHLANIRRGTIDPAYRWQCVFSLYFTGKDWLDFVSYCADFPVGKQLFICRAEANDIADDVERLLERVEQFKPLVDAAKNDILSGEYNTNFAE